MGMIVPTQKTNAAMQEIFLKAVVRGNKRGSTTSAMWSYLLMKCVVDLVRTRVAQDDQDEEVLLICDSGGGSPLHLFGALSESALQLGPAVVFRKATQGAKKRGSGFWV